MIKPDTAGEIFSQCSSSSVMPSTPPSVTPEKEWTWYSPKARNALLSAAIMQDIGFSFNS